MACNRLFLLGVVLLFMGIQLRLVKTYELNPTVNQFVDYQIAKRVGGASLPGLSSSYDYGSDVWSVPTPLTSISMRTFSPPSWLGWSFVSMGAVLVLICPCYR